MERTNSFFSQAHTQISRHKTHSEADYIFNINVFHWIYTCLPSHIPTNSNTNPHPQTCEFFSSLNLFFTVTFCTSYCDCSRCRPCRRHHHRGSLCHYFLFFSFAVWIFIIPCILYTQVWFIYEKFIEKNVKLERKIVWQIIYMYIYRQQKHFERVWMNKTKKWARKSIWMRKCGW